jgi:enoyl-[acyl-carrier protein] reductase II
MLRTALCELLDIEYPVILAPMGSATSAEFAAAASNAGGLGSIGTLGRTREAVLRDVQVARELTSRPYAVNHIPHLLDEEAFRATLDARPAVVSFALADPGDLVARAHDAGAKVLVQVATVAQAEQAAERGADAVIAQGGEAGGFGGHVATMVLVPQAVDAVAPLPVVAAGGIFDGRGLAAALLLGAAGVNLGTRFLASQEAPIDEAWRQAVLAAASEDAVKFDLLNDILPYGSGGYGTVLRSIRTSFMAEWEGRRQEAQAQIEAVREQALSAMQAGRRNEVLLTAGQSAGAIRSVLPVAEIMQSLVEEAESSLRRGGALIQA